MFRKAPFAAATLTAATAANAAPVFFAGTGHYYEFIQASISWTGASAAANASTHLGQSGYLATIVDQPRRIFLLSLANDGWIGATDEAIEGLWSWVEGSSDALAGMAFHGDPDNGGIGCAPGYFCSWNGGEPNNVGGEDYAHLQGGVWNDLPNGNNRGYFVEYDAPDGEVPEPAMLGLLGLGALGLAAVRRRTR